MLDLGNGDNDAGVGTRRSSPGAAGPDSQGCSAGRGCHGGGGGTKGGGGGGGSKVNTVSVLGGSCLEGVVAGLCLALFTRAFRFLIFYHTHTALSLATSL